MDPKKPVQIVKDALEKAAAKATELVTPPIPGVPASEPPLLEPPTKPRGPLPPKPDQAAPATVTPTGAETGASPRAFGQQAQYLTTAQGARLYTTDHSLKAGDRGPTLLQDHQRNQVS